MGEKQITLPDKAARTTALTAIDRSFLVEAGAGSGKTSIMAGRVAVLFAGGVEPKHVAAITFTEFAASELLDPHRSVREGTGQGTVPPISTVRFQKGFRPSSRKTSIGQESTRPTRLHDHPRLRPGADQALSGRGRIDPGAEISIRPRGILPSRTLRGVAQRTSLRRSATTTSSPNSSSPTRRSGLELDPRDRGFPAAQS